MAAARALKAQQPRRGLSFHQRPQHQPDSRQMWARVKAETERDLMAFNEAVCWRPAAIDGVPSAREPFIFKVARPILRIVFGPFRGLYVKGEDIGRAMLEATKQDFRSRIVENAELRDLADRWQSRTNS